MLILQIGKDVVAALQGCIERKGHKMRIAALVLSIPSAATFVLYIVIWKSTYVA